MATDRYSRVPIIGRRYGTSFSHTVVRQGIASGVIRYQQFVLHEGERLDTLAGKFYDDSGYWWIIAAASDIRWGLQVPPGTIINVPNLDDVLKYFE